MAGSATNESGEVGLIKEGRSSLGQEKNKSPSMSTSYWDCDDVGSNLSGLYGSGLLEIDKYSNQKEQICSEMIDAGGYKWWAGFYPEGSTKHSVRGKIMLSFCPEDRRKEHRGFSVLAQFTIAMVHKDHERPKYYISIIHKFTYDNGMWLAHMEKKKLEEYICGDNLMIEVQVQVIRERKDRPFCCLASRYKRELLRAYLTDVELGCEQFVKECMGQYVEQFNSPSWSILEAFWNDMNTDSKKKLTCVEREIVLTKVVQKNPVEKTFCGTLIMESFCCGLKDIEVKEGVLKQKGSSFVYGDDTKDLFSILKESFEEPLPPKDGSPRGEFNKDLFESDERRLVDFGRWTIERFVLTLMFSNVVSANNEQHWRAGDGGSLPNFNPNASKKARKSKKTQVTPKQTKGKGHGDNDGDEVEENKFETIEPVLENNLTQLHLMTISNKILGQGFSSKVFEGEFSYIPVAIKQIHCKKGEETPKEIENIRKVGYHPNLVVYHGCEWDEENSYLYLAFERCTCTLQDLITGNDDIGFKRDLLWGEDTKTLFDLIGAIIDGVGHLHSWNLVHRDLTPENILVKVCKSKDGGCSLIPKISDFGLLKDLDETEVLPLDLDGEKMLTSSQDFLDHYMYRNRKIPEQDKSQRLTKKTDIYCLGLVIAFILSKGEINKVSGQNSDLARFVPFFFKTDKPEACRFLMSLAEDNPALRPSLNKIKKDPFLWSPLMKIDFLEHTFVFLKDKETQTASDILKDAFVLVCGENVTTWMEKLEDNFKNDANLGVTSTNSFYDGRKLMDLLRFIRNKKHHPESVSLTRDAVARYFCRTFPHLFNEVYKIVKKTYKKEGSFSQYFEQEKDDDI